MIGKAWLGSIALTCVVAVVAFAVGVRTAARLEPPAWPGSAVATGGVGGDIGSGPPGEVDSFRFAPETGARPSAVPLPDTIPEILLIPTDFTSTYAAYALAAGADEGDLLDLIEEAKQVEGQNDRLALIAILIGRYGEIDPVRALDYIVGSDLEAKPNLVYRVVSAWSKLDLGAALEGTRRLASAELKRAAGDAILAAHSDAGAAALADIRARLSESSGVVGLSPQTVLQMAATDPAAALAETAEALTGQERMAASAVVGGVWAQTDPRAAFAHSRTISDPTVRDAFLRGVILSWTDLDPGSVLRLLEDDPSDAERAAVLNVGVVRLTFRDAREALRRVSTLEEPGVRNVALQRVFRTWAREDPFAAAAALDEVASGDRLNLGELVGREFALRAPAEALEWAASFVSDFDGPYRVVMTEVARSDPRLALDASYALREPNERRRAISLVLTTVAERDPVAAAGYWQQVPADAKADAAAQIVARWQAQDPEAAAGWLLSLPSGPERDAGLARYVMTASSEDRDAVRIVNAMASAERRDQHGVNRIGRLVREGSLRQAELELGRIQFSADGYRDARAMVDPAGR